MLSTDTVPLTIGTTPDEEAAFAHAIADRLAEDIVAHCGWFVRLFRRKVELYALPLGHHINSDSLQHAECQQSHINLSEGDATRREMTRRVVEETIPTIIARHHLPFTGHAVEVVKVETYTFIDAQDRYSMDFALRIVLTR